MQCIPCSVIECRVFHAAWRNGTLLNAVDFMKHEWMQWIPCSMIECSGFYAAWPKASRLNAVDSMQRHWMQRIPCIEAQWILIVCSGVMQRGPMHPDQCSGFKTALPKESGLNAVDSRHCDWNQWNPCSMLQWIPTECSGFPAALCNWYQCNAVDSMHRDSMQWIPCSVVKWIPSECSGFHALWLNAVHSI